MATISVTFTSTNHGIINFTYALEESSISRILEVSKQNFKENDPARFTPDINTGYVPPDPSIQESLQELTNKLINYIITSTCDKEVENKLRQYRDEVPFIKISG